MGQVKLTGALVPAAIALLMVGCSSSVRGPVYNDQDQIAAKIGCTEVRANVDPRNTAGYQWTCDLPNGHYLDITHYKDHKTQKSLNRALSDKGYPQANVNDEWTITGVPETLEDMDMTETKADVQAAAQALNVELQ